VYADPDNEATVSASGAIQSKPITPRRREYAPPRQVALFRHTPKHSIRNEPDELV